MDLQALQVVLAQQVESALQVQLVLPGRLAMEVLQVLLAVVAWLVSRGQRVPLVQALWVQQALPAHRGLLVRIVLVLQVRQVHSVQLALLLLLPALQVQRGQLVIQALQVLPAQLALLAKRVPLVPQDQQDPLDPLGRLERKAYKDLMALPVQQGLKVLLVRLGRQALLVHKVQTVLQVQRVLLARLAPQVQLEIKELRVLLDPQAQLVLAAQLGRKDHKVTKAQQAQQARLGQLARHQLLLGLLGQRVPLARLRLSQVPQVPQGQRVQLALQVLFTRQVVAPIKFSMKMVRLLQQTIRLHLVKTL